MGDRLATVDMGRKVGAGVFFPWGSWIPLNTMWPGPRTTSVPNGILIHSAVWPQWTWIEKWITALPLFLGGAGFPSNKMSPGRGLRPYQVVF